VRTPEHPHPRTTRGWGRESGFGSVGYDESAVKLFEALFSFVPPELHPRLRASTPVE
jgi:hypothetical protein